MTVIALGVVPYISSSIIMQLLTALWPACKEKLKKTLMLENEKLQNIPAC